MAKLKSMTFLDFLLDSVFFLELLCAIIASICFFKYNSTSLKFVLIYLWLVCITEFSAKYLTLQLPNNVLLYNFLSLIEFCIFSYIFYKELKIIFFRKVIFISVFIFSICLFIDIFYTGNPVESFLSLAYGCSSILLSLYCCFYFYYVAQTEKILNLYQILFSWICIGLLVYHLCNLPITVLSNQLHSINENDNLLSILALSGMLMYICFITGFLWSKKEYNYSLF